MSSLSEATPIILTIEERAELEAFPPMSPLVLK
jgi:hypothetical protein